MVDVVSPLDPAIHANVAGQLQPNECIDHWFLVPNNDLVVALIDRDLQRVVGSLVEKAGPPPLGCGRTLVFAVDSGNWSQVGLGSWGMGSANLLRYFKTAACSQAEPSLQRGIHLCYRWMVLEGKSSVTQDEVDEWLALFDAEPAPSPVWREMRRQFAHWAVARRFSPRRVW